MKMINTRNCKSKMDDGTCRRAKSFGITGIRCSNYVCIMKQNAGNETNEGYMRICGEQKTHATRENTAGSN